LAAEIQAEHPGTEIRLVKASGGVFEVMLDGKLIFSKHQLRRHAQPGEVLGLIRERLGS